MNAVTEYDAVLLADCLNAVCEDVLVFAFPEPSAFRVAGALLDVLLLLTAGSFLL